MVEKLELKIKDWNRVVRKLKDFEARISALENQKPVVDQSTPDDNESPDIMDF